MHHWSWTACTQKETIHIYKQPTDRQKDGQMDKTDRKTDRVYEQKLQFKMYSTWNMVLIIDVLIELLYVHYNKSVEEKIDWWPLWQS